ncbi:MAG: type II toxin-antitoxin system RelE/ParE family toxin [Rhodomicrobium sp.]
MTPQVRWKAAVGTDTGYRQESRIYSADRDLDAGIVFACEVHCLKVANLLHMKAWTVETLNAAVDAELEALPADMRARFVRIAGMIEALGLEKVGNPHVDHIEGALWEIRMKGADGIARALYVTAKGKRVVVVRVFVKKTQKTPRQEIELALKRAKDVT